MEAVYTTLFTDGSSRGNPGPGGFGVIIAFRDGRIQERGGREDGTTNNRMELSGALDGLRAVGRSEPVRIFTDSRYLINGITKWVHGWRKTGWKTSAKEDVLNRDLWEALYEETKGREIEWRYVRGHAGTAGNERADKIATAFADKVPVKLYDGPRAQYPIAIENTDAQPVKKERRARADFKAYSYVSVVEGAVEIHKTWADCEQRVKGTSGAKFKKTRDAADEASVIAELTGR